MSTLAFYLRAGILCLLATCAHAVDGDVEAPVHYRVPDVLMQETFSALLDFGMVEQAEERAQQVSIFSQRRSASSYIRARVAVAAERYRDAERYLREAVAYDSANFAAWSELGHVLAGTQRYRSAVAAWQHVLAASGADDAELLLSCGLLESQLEDHAAAASHLLQRRLLEPDPLQVSAEIVQLDAALGRSLRELGNVQLVEALERERISLLHELAASQTNELASAQRWMMLVEELFGLGDLESARAAARIRLREGPFEGQYSNYLATHLKMRFILLDALLSGDGLHVIELCNELDGRDLLHGIPSDWRKEIRLADALYEAGSDFATLGNEAGAARLFAEALRHDPQHVLARNNLGYAAMEHGPITRTDIALIESSAADARDGQSESLATVLDTIGWLRYMQSHLNDDAHTRGALSLLRESIDLQESPDPIVLDHLGDATWLSGDKQEAMQVWNAALSRLSDPEFRGQAIRNYNLLQGGLWQFHVVDSESMYDREYGALMGSLKAKLSAAKNGDPPPVAERRTFIP
ncbi:MAG: tetratricopeptide repeat protein [Phycisphaerales bacterium]|nr:tetratricopeptide repeat protein [Phycisphaerales bacterium]